MTLKKLLKNPDIKFSQLVALETDYNECGGYLSGYYTNDEDAETIDIYFNCCSDCVYSIAHELAEHLNIPFR